MPRFARTLLPGSIQHIISRFVNRAFRLVSEQERDAYLLRLSAALARCDWTLLGFALMGNHVHLCALAGQLPSMTLIKPAHTGFAGWLNRSQGTLGPVFAQRHKTIVVPPEHALRLLAYLHNNPVRARLADSPSASSWTSHRAYVGLDPAPPWLQVEQGLHLCGFATSEAGRQAFHQAVCDRAGLPRDPELSGEDWAAVRARVRQRVGAPVEIGAAALAAAPGAGAEHSIVAKPATPLRPRWPGEVQEVLTLVALQTGISLERLQSRERTRAVAGARRLALLVWTEPLGRSLGEMSMALGLSNQAGSALLRRQTGRVKGLQSCARRVGELCWQGTPGS